MPRLVTVGGTQTAQLSRQAFGTLDCHECGVVVLRGADSWGAHERGYIELPHAEGMRRVGIAYDEREAPYAVDNEGREDKRFLLSLSDEDDYLACAWVRVGEDSPLLGVGIDLSAAEHFKERTHGRDLSRLLFTPEELTLEPELGASDLKLAYAALFASKEAAFKATAAPLRRWDDDHDERLRFEVRHFVMERPGIERGTGRNAAAQDAMDAMGIARIEVRHVEIADMALVVATALAR